MRSPSDVRLRTIVPAPSAQSGALPSFIGNTATTVSGPSGVTSMAPMAIGSSRTSAMVSSVTFLIVSQPLKIIPAPAEETPASRLNMLITFGESPARVASVYWWTKASTSAWEGGWGAGAQAEQMMASAQMVHRDFMVYSPQKFPGLNVFQAVVLVDDPQPLRGALDDERPHAGCADLSPQRPLADFSLCDRHPDHGKHNVGRERRDIDAFDAHGHLAGGDDRLLGHRSYRFPAAEHFAASHRGNGGLAAEEVHDFRRVAGARRCRILMHESVDLGLGRR